MRAIFLTITIALSTGGAAIAEEKCPKGNAPIFEEDLQAIPDCDAAHALHDADLVVSRLDEPALLGLIESADGKSNQHEH